MPGSEVSLEMQSCTLLRSQFVRGDSAVRMHNHTWLTARGRTAKGSEIAIWSSLVVRLSGSNA